MAACKIRSTLLSLALKALCSLTLPLLISSLTAKPHAPCQLAKSGYIQLPHLPGTPFVSLCYALFLNVRPPIYTETFVFFQDPNLLELSSPLSKNPCKINCFPFLCLHMSFVHVP